MTHLEQVLDHAIRKWERKWEPPPPGTTQPGAVLANAERAAAVREAASAMLDNYTLDRLDGGGTEPATIGASIQQARESRSMTQDQLATEMGVSRSTVCHWERGDRAPTESSRLQLRGVLRTPIPGWLPLKLR